MGYTPAQVRALPWHDERLILEGLASEAEDDEGGGVVGDIDDLAARMGG